MIRTCQVQSAPEVLVILTHSRISAGAASALGVGERRAAHRLHSHLPAYSGVGDKPTQQAGRQSCQVAGKIPQCWTSYPVAGGGAERGLGGCKRHVLVVLSTRGRRATRACGPGQSRRETVHHAVCPAFQGLQLFSSPLLPEAILVETVSLQPHLLSLAGEERGMGELPGAPLWAQKEVPVELSSGFRLKLSAMTMTPCLLTPNWRTLLI